jgi:hypothetical protein
MMDKHMEIVYLNIAEESGATFLPTAPAGIKGPKKISQLDMAPHGRGMHATTTSPTYLLMQATRTQALFMKIKSV